MTIESTSLSANGYHDLRHSNNHNDADPPVTVSRDYH